jgi:hypothetical protein
MKITRVVQARECFLKRRLHETHGSTGFDSAQPITEWSTVTCDVTSDLLSPLHQAWRITIGGQGKPQVNLLKFERNSYDPF